MHPFGQIKSYDGVPMSHLSDRHGTRIHNAFLYGKLQNIGYPLLNNLKRHYRLILLGLNKIKTYFHVFGFVKKKVSS